MQSKEKGEKNFSLDVQMAKLHQNHDVDVDVFAQLLASSRERERKKVNGLISVIKNFAMLRRPLWRTFFLFSPFSLLNKFALG